MYYNTTSEKGSRLKRSRTRTRTQEEKIFSFFLTYGEPLSPSMILDKMNLKCPITSVRRALTDLTKKGKLTKIDELVMGGYGKKEHLWRLKKEDDNNDQYQLFNI